MVPYIIIVKTQLITLITTSILTDDCLYLDGVSTCRHHLTRTMLLMIMTMMIRVYFQAWYLPPWWWSHWWWWSWSLREYFQALSINHNDHDDLDVHWYVLSYRHNLFHKTVMAHVAISGDNLRMINQQNLKYSLVKYRIT